MSETIAAVIIATMGSIVGSILIYITALKRAKPEGKNLEADSKEHEANAASQALLTTERATQQLYATMKDLDGERTRRRELQVMVDEIKDQAEKRNKDLEAKLEEQRIDYEKKLAHQKAEFERQLDIMRGNMAALASQVVQLGGTPIKFVRDQ